MSDYQKFTYHCFKVCGVAYDYTGQTYTKYSYFQFLLDLFKEFEYT